MTKKRSKNDDFIWKKNDGKNDNKTMKKGSILTRKIRLKPWKLMKTKKTDNKMTETTNSYKKRVVFLSLSSTWVRSVTVIWSLSFKIFIGDNAGKKILNCIYAKNPQNQTSDYRRKP